MQLYYDLNRRKATDKQTECYNCGKRIDGSMYLLGELAKHLTVSSAVLRGGRYCEYTGKYFCKTCHVNDASIIPARIIHVRPTSVVTGC